MRIAIALLIVLLAGCSAASPSSRLYASACLAIPRSDVAAALAAYDRQIATLRALVTVPASPSTVSPRTIAANAAAHVAALARTAQRHALLDPASVENALQVAYARQADTVRTHATQAHDAYSRALAQQVNTQSSALANALANRVRDAYDAREQLYRERANDAYVARATAVANRELQLRIKLAALARTDTQRRALDGELAAIERTLAARAAADRARDGAMLATYRRSLEATASTEYASTVAELRRKAAANLALGGAVTNAQQITPAALAIDFDAPLHAAMATGASSVLAAQSSQATTAHQTEADFNASGNDLAQRFAAVAASEEATAASVRAELLQMQRARSALATVASNSCHAR